MIKPYQLLLLGLGAYCSVFSQQIKPFVVNTAGATLTGSSGQITGNLGEIAITRINNSTNSITQGFLQPKLLPNAIEETSINQINVFPNPSSKNIYFNLDKNINGVSVKILDGFGRIVYNAALENNTVSIEKYPTGLYQILLIDANKKIITQKNISKIN